jgi:hypothetical protein
VTVKVVFECNGCPARAEAIAKAEFISFTGRDHGFGRIHEDSISSLAPEGWEAFDPYTCCCYCPKCWAGITAGIEEKKVT